MTADARTLIRLTESLAAISSLIAGLELWRRRDLLRDDGALSWRIHRLRSPRVTRVLVATGVDRIVFQYPSVLGWLWLRIAAACLIPICAFEHWPTALPLLVLVVTNTLFTVRNPVANDGGDQLGQLILIACTLAEIFQSPVAFSACLIFLAAQSALAYATSGWLKAPHRGWWNGQFLLKIMSTSFAGDRSLWLFLTAHRRLARVAGAVVVVADCALGFAALLPPPVCLLVLGLGVLLHLGIARVMGLNTFVWTFVATYPSVWFVCCLLHHRVSG